MNKRTFIFRTIRQNGEVLVFSKLLISNSESCILAPECSF